MAFENPDFVNRDLKYVNYSEGSLDERTLVSMKLLEEAPLHKIEKVLDLGMGRGDFSMWFAKKGKKVTGTGINLNSYNLDFDLFKRHNIEVVECHIDKLPFNDETFDAVLLSHVLEHCFDISVALKEIRRVLKKDGYLFVFVPEHITEVTATHVVMGWSVGQILITLLLNGFNVKNGKFLHKAHQICAFVQRSEVSLPELRGDSGDNYILYKAGLFPEQLEFTDRNFEVFEGDIPSINWDTVVRQSPVFTKKQQILIALSKLLPKSVLRSVVFYLRIAYNTLNNFWFVSKS